MESGRRKEDWQKYLLERKKQFRDQTERYKDMTRQLRLLEEQRADQIPIKERALKQSLDEPEKSYAKIQAVTSAE